MFADTLSKKELVLYHLSRRDCMIDMSGMDYLMPTQTIANLIGCSKSTAYRILKQLLKEGLVAKGSEGVYNEDEYRPLCYRGWYITPKVRYTDVFKRANWEVSKAMRTCWDIVPAQYYATNTAQWHSKFSERSNIHES